MGYFADDDEIYDDDDYYDDDGDLDDEEDEQVGFKPSAAINPFRTGGSGASGSGNPPASSRFGSGSSLGSRSPASPSSGGNSASRDPKEIANDRAKFFGSGSSANPSAPSGGTSRFGSNPSPSSSGGGGGLPGSGRFGGSGSSPQSPTSGENKPTSPASPGGASRFGSNNPSSGGGGGSSTFGSSGSRFGGSGSGGDNDNKPSSPSSPGGSSRFGGSGSGSGSGSPGGSGSGGSSTFGGSGSRFGGSGDKPASPGGGDSRAASTGSFPAVKRDDAKTDDKKNDSSSGGSRFGAFGNRGGDTKDDAKKDDKPAASTGGSRFGFGKKDDEKKDDKPAASTGAGLGRFGLGGAKKDDKPTDKKDDKSANAGGGGSRLGGLTSSLPLFGGKKDDATAPKKDNKPADAGSGGVASRLGGAGAAVSGIAGRFGGKKDDAATPKKDNKSADAGSGGSRFGSLGGMFNRNKDAAPADNKSAAKPAADSRTTGEQKKAGGLGGMSPFGRSKAGEDAAKDAKGKAPAAEKTSLFSRLGASLPFGSSAAVEKSATKKSRASKIPQAKENAGLSLDDKLDILGVSMVVGSIILFLSSLSGQQGAVTAAINGSFTYLFGWGAVAVPLVTFGIGMWLIFRHFGEQAPVIDPVRVSGLAVLYVGGLALLMFIETFNPLYASIRFAEELVLYLNFSVEMGRGGGIVGAELYAMLISSVGEIGAIFAIVGVEVIGLMLATRTTAAELAVFVISIYRSLTVSVQHRAQERRARRMEVEEQNRLAAQAAAAQAQISVVKPAAAELTPGTATAGALPAPEAIPVAIPIQERSIPIRMGGQMMTESVEKPAAAPPPTTLPGAAPMPAPAAASNDSGSSGGSRFGGFASRIAGAAASLPALGSRSSDNGDSNQVTAAKPLGEETSSKPAASLGSLLGRKSSSDDASIPSSGSFKSTPPSAPASSGKPPAAPADNAPPSSSRFGSFQRPAATTSDQPAATAPAPAMSTQSAPPKSEDTPFTRPAFSKPETPAPAASIAAPAPDKSVDADMLPEDDLLSRLAPAQPKAAGIPAARPAPTSTFASRFGQTPSTFKAVSAADDDEEDDDLEDEADEAISAFSASSKPSITAAASTEDKKDASGSGADRMNRLNAIRSGQTAAKPANDLRSMLDDDDDDLMIDDDDDDELDTIRAKASKVEDEDEDDESVAPEDVIRSAPNPFGDYPARPSGGSTSVIGGAAPKSTLPGRPSVVPSAAAGSTPKIEPRPFNSPFRKPGESDPEKGDVTRPAAFKPPSMDAGSLPKQGETAKPPLPSAPLRVTPDMAAAKAEPAESETPRPAATPAPRKQNWKLPEYRTLLTSGSEHDFDREQLVKRARMIEETLMSFGAPGRVVEINTGPVITQFGVEPDYLVVRGGKKNRVKVGAIAQLDKDLQLALGAKSIRVEAPVPGKGYVGIEVPNEEAALVSLRDVMESDQFGKIKSPLAIALGQSVDGTPIAADLTSMPHLLIAGTTGSGKSVCVNSIIASLITLNTPEAVKLIMVDPKRVELTGYNGIPHLVAPVVVELERIVGVLKWVTREMDDRYKKFSNAGARNIVDYNENLASGLEKMPYIVVIIDELADLMMLAPDETERVITRIAALARATGIHLVIATQRPSVDVVTGLIKANFPARIAFAVAGSVDSRVILDQPGAERLLGKGDMLYMSGDSPAPLRLQGVWVSDMEINNICRFWRTQSIDNPVKAIASLVGESSSSASSAAPPSGSIIPPGERFRNPPPPSTQVSASAPGPQKSFWDNEAVSSRSNGSDDNDPGGGKDDELYGEAVEMVRRLNKASVSLLQRRLRIGYTRAARLIDVMEAEGIVGPATEGSKPREVLPLNGKHKI